MMGCSEAGEEKVEKWTECGEGREFGIICCYHGCTSRGRSGRAGERPKRTANADRGAKRLQSGSVRRVNWRREIDEALGQRASGGRERWAARNRRQQYSSETRMEPKRELELKARRDDEIRRREDD